MRSGARVDYFRMMTGAPRSETIEDPRRPGETLRVQRVEELYELLTCAECWQLPAVQRELERRFRSGLA